MIKQRDADSAKGLAQFQCQLDIGFGGGSAATGVIVGEDQPTGTALRGDADDVPRVYAYLRGIARTDLGRIETLHACIQTDDIEFFVFFSFEQGFTVVCGGCGRGEKR